MSTSPVPDEDDGLLHDLARETWKSFVKMPRWAQATLTAGIAVHVAAVLIPSDVMPHAAHAAMRVAAFLAIVVGLIENAKTLDEFYVRVYLDACAIGLVLSSVIIYASSNFGIEYGIRAVSIFAATFLLGFVVAFARLRRSA